MVSTSLKTADLVRTLRLHKSEEKYLGIISRIVHLDRLVAEFGRPKDDSYKHQRAALFRELREHISDKRVDEIYERIAKLQNNPS